MSERSRTGLTLAALVIAVLGWTPLGEAARQAVFPPNSVGTVQLKGNAVTSPKIRNGSVQAIDIQKASITAAHVKPRSLLATSFRAGQLPAGPKGDKGDKGDKGEKGDKGDKGDVGLAGHQFLQSALVSVAAGQVGFATVTCPQGKRVLGGGGHIAGAASGAGFLWQSIPVSNTAWRVAYKNTTNSNASIWAYAVCAAVAS
jgi:hypothetical protein